MKRFPTQPGGGSFLIRKLVRQNLVYLIVILLLIVGFGISLYLGTRQVYEEEAQWRSQKTMAKRSYKEGLSHVEAMNRIVADKNQHFDPDVVDAFLECEEKLLAIT